MCLALAEPILGIAEVLMHRNFCGDILLAAGMPNAGKRRP